MLWSHALCVSSVNEKVNIVRIEEKLGVSSNLVGVSSRHALFAI